MLHAIHSDKGRYKKVNQDSALVKKADTENGEVLFSIVCDGMGGLNDGELASAEVITALQDWFLNDLPLIMSEGVTPGRLKESLTARIVEEDEKLTAYSDMIIKKDSTKKGCGTTLTGAFLCAGHFLCVNVGDSRVYKISGKETELLTHDQTLVQQMVDSGDITEKEALTHKMRSTLLQCIGVEGDVVPVYTEGTYKDGDLFLLCSDGFRHKLEEREFPAFFPEQEMTDKKRMKRCCVRAVDEAIARGERDNVTVVIIRT